MGQKYFSVTIATLIVTLSTPVLAEEKKLTFSATAGIEYDDNISVSVLDQSTGQSDEALVLDFSTGYMVLTDEAQEVELTYDFYQSIHNTLDDFDLQIHTLSALGSWDVNGLDTGLDYNYSKVYLSSDSLYQSHSLTPSLGFSGLKNHYHRLSYAYLDKDFNSASSSRDAKQNSISADNYYFFMDSKAYISLGLRFEDEDTKDNELDYQGSYLKLATSLPLFLGGEHPSKLKVNLQRYWKDYDNITASIGQVRADEQDLIGIELIKPLYKDVSLKFNYEYINTDSNLPSVEAKENILTLSLTAVF